MKYRIGFILLLTIIMLSGHAQLSVTMNSQVNTKCNGNGCYYEGPSILINEVMIKPTTGNGSIYGSMSGTNPEGEWIELYNPDKCKPIDISCYFLGNNAPDNGSGNYGGGFELPAGTVVPPRGFVVVRGNNAPAVPANLLVQNGGRTIEVVVSNSPRVCVGGGNRLWFPDAGGWFAFYDANGVPQDAISWNSTTNSDLNGSPCNPPNNCPFQGNLASYNAIPAARKTYIENGNPATGQSYRRNPDGGPWVLNTQAAATYGTCNAACIPAPVITCVGRATVIPAGGTPPYTYIWDDGQLQNTATATGLCAGTYCVTVTDATGSSVVGCVDVTDLVPPVSFNTVFPQVCMYAPSFALNGGTPAGGTYTGNGLIGSVFNPYMAGPGNHMMIYSYSDSNACINSDTSYITVLAVPNVTFNAIPGICTGAQPVSLNAATPAGGTYSGPGVSGNFFDPALTGPGTYTLKYKLTLAGGCSDSATQTITVHPLPMVSMPSLPIVCLNTAPFNLAGATPPGGTWSGPGVNGNAFDPMAAGVGNHVLTYTYSDAFNCTNSGTTTLTVHPLPTVTLANINDHCIDDPAFALSGGLPVGGTYSGNGVSSNSFDPSFTGPGTFQIYYSFANTDGCVNIDTTTITVHPLPSVNFSGIMSACVNGLPFPLNGGIPAGGVYSGTGVAGNVFTPANAGIGTFTITYTYTDSYSCTNSATDDITVYGLPVVTMTPRDTICVSASPVLMTGGLPSGGTWSGPGISGNSFDPTITGIGDFNVTYSFTDNNGCAGSASLPVHVVSLPNVTFTVPASLCINAPPVVLVGGFPAGGTYSGVGVNAGQFDPAIPGPGSYPITYTYTDHFNCTNSAVQNISVYNLPNVTLLPFPGTCVNSNPVVLTGGNPGGGTFSGTGVGNGIFDPVITGPGSFSLTYTFRDIHNCENSTSQSIQVNNLPLAFPVLGGGIICHGGPGTPIMMDTSENGVEYQMFLNGQPRGFPNTGTGNLLTFGNQPDSGTYTMHATNPITGCSNVMLGTAHIGFIEPPMVNLGDSVYICDQTSVTIDAGSFLPDSVLYIWSDSSTARYYQVKEPGLIWVRVGKGDCFGADSLKVKECADLTVPNVFTPNDDGKNDRFLAKASGDIMKFYLTIFDRWGKIVYESSDITEGWDGTHYKSGKDCDDGVYFWVITYIGYGRSNPPKESKLSGQVTLLR